MKLYVVVVASVMMLQANNAFSQTSQGLGDNFSSSIISTNIRPELFNDISFGGFNLLATSVQYSKENSLQKVVISPFKLVRKGNFLKDSRVNFAQKDGISTFGFAFAYDNTNPYNGGRKVKKAFNNLGTIPSFPPRRSDESEDDFASRKKKFDQDMDHTRVDFMKSLAKNTFSITAGYNISLFEILGGSKIRNTSGADSGLVSNMHSTKSHNYSIDLNYGLNEHFAVNIGGTFKKQRQSAVELQDFVDYYGFNTSVTGRIIYLVDKDKLLDNEDYKRSLFIPSILLGASFESLNAAGKPSFVKDHIRRQFVFTPFIDIKISPKSQFRLSFPLRKFTKTGSDLFSAGPFVQYTLELANLN